MSFDELRNFSKNLRENVDNRLYNIEQERQRKEQEEEKHREEMRIRSNFEQEVKEDVRGQYQAEMRAIQREAEAEIRAVKMDADMEKRKYQNEITMQNSRWAGEIATLESKNNQERKRLEEEMERSFRAKLGQQKSEHRAKEKQFQTEKKALEDLIKEKDSMINQLKNELEEYIDKTTSKFSETKEQKRISSLDKDIQKRAKKLQGNPSSLSEVKVDLIKSLLPEGFDFTHQLENNPLFKKFVLNYYPEITHLVDGSFENVRQKVDEYWDNALASVKGKAEKEKITYQKTQEIGFLNQLLEIAFEAKEKGKIQDIKTWLHKIFILQSPLEEGVFKLVGMLTHTVRENDVLIQSLSNSQQDYQIIQVRQKIFTKNGQSELVFLEDLEMSHYQEERNIYEEVYNTAKATSDNIREQKQELKEISLNNQKAALNIESHIRDKFHELSVEKANVRLAAIANDLRQQQQMLERDKRDMEHQFEKMNLQQEKNSFNLQKRADDLDFNMKMLKMEKAKLAIETRENKLLLDQKIQEVIANSFELKAKEQELNLNKKQHNLDITRQYLDFDKREFLQQQKEKKIELTYHQWQVEKAFQQKEFEENKRMQDMDYQTKLLGLTSHVEELKDKARKQAIEIDSKKLELAEQNIILRRKYDDFNFEKRQAQINEFFSTKSSAYVTDKIMLDMEKLKVHNGALLNAIKEYQIKTGTLSEERFLKIADRIDGHLSTSKANLFELYDSLEYHNQVTEKQWKAREYGSYESYLKAKENESGVENDFQIESPSQLDIDQETDEYNDW